MKEDVKPEVLSEMSLATVADSTADVPHLHKIKLEYSLSEPHSYHGFVEHADVKHEDTTTELLNYHIKSEVLDLKCDIDEIYVKFEPLKSEELHINNEVEASLVDETTKEVTQVKYFYCDICNKKFEYKKSLQGHLLIHTAEKPFQCNICHYKCIRKGYLEQHMKTHTGEKPLKCNICDYSCIWKCSLEHHNLKAHTEERPFKCSVCNYSCVRAYDIRLHMKIHTGEKPFQCSLCDFKARQKNSIQRHMKTHTGEKPFQCYVCIYKCIQKSTLKRHMKTHT